MVLLVLPAVHVDLNRWGDVFGGFPLPGQNTGHGSRHHGALINNLIKDDFILTEHCQLQQIKYFALETDVPLTIGLLVDVSGSQGGLIDIERQAASQFSHKYCAKMMWRFSSGSAETSTFCRILPARHACSRLRSSEQPTAWPGTVNRELGRDCALRRRLRCRDRAAHAQSGPQGDGADHRHRFWQRADACGRHQSRTIGRHRDL